VHVHRRVAVLVALRKELGEAARRRVPPQVVAQLRRHLLARHEVEPALPPHVEGLESAGKPLLGGRPSPYSLHAVLEQPARELRARAEADGDADRCEEDGEQPTRLGEGRVVAVADRGDRGEAPEGRARPVERVDVRLVQLAAL
jgi:hypothetical protein